MIDPIVGTMVFVIAIVVHELGHWLAFKYHKVPVVFEVHWYGILCRTPTKKGTMQQLWQISSAGIIAGSLVVAMTLDNYLMIVYIAACCLDIAVLFQITELKRKGFPLELDLSELKSSYTYKGEIKYL